MQYFLAALCLLLLAGCENDTVRTVRPTATGTRTETPVPATPTFTLAATRTATPEVDATATATHTTAVVETPTELRPTSTATPSVSATASLTPSATPSPTSSVLVITTFVGNGLAGSNGDGLAAQATALYLPQDVTVAPNGDLYFADWNNHRIRRVRGGRVETFAGTGELGDARDGLALETQFNHPTNVAFDADGNAIVAAWHNSKVKRVDVETGLIENLAGTGGRSFGGDLGPANDAILDLPSSVVVEDDGSIVISDQANFRLRRIRTDGIIETICGSGTQGYSGDGGPCIDAELNSPVGQAAPPAGRIAADGSGRIYIADTGNHCIRRVNLDLTIETIAGGNGAGYSGDGGAAIAAQLTAPSDVAVADDGTVYIADTKNNVIRKIDTAGVIHTVAGTGEAGFAGDGDAAQNALLDRPYGVDVGTDGTVWIADTHNHRVRRLTYGVPPDWNPDTGPNDPPVEIIPCTGELGSICTFSGTGHEGFNGDGRNRLFTILYWPYDIEFTASGRVIVLDWNNHRVREILPTDEFVTLIGTDFIGDGPIDQSDRAPGGANGLAVDLNHPTDVIELPDGDLLLMAWHNHKLRILDSGDRRVRVLVGGAASFAGDGGPASDALLNQPPHSSLDAAGNLFIVDQRNQRIRVIEGFAEKRGDGIIRTVAGTGVAGFNGDGPASETQIDLPAGGNPEPAGGIAVDLDGSVYFADTFNHRIRRIVDPLLPEARVETIAGTGVPGFSGDGGAATDAQLNLPEDLEIGPDGKLYFADADNHRVRRVDLFTGVIETVAGNGVQGYSGDGGPALQASLNRPFGVAFDSVGDLYISDTFNGRVRVVSLGLAENPPTRIFPADYEQTYVEVRDCRFSNAHDGLYVRVLASPLAAHPYLNEDNPLPIGGVLIKEEYRDQDCNPDSFVGWRVMRKEDPGFDSDFGDWHWQRLAPDGRIVTDVSTPCIGCHLAPDCVERDFVCTEAGDFNPRETRLILEELPGALLSISGRAEDDIYAVGADPGDGFGPMVMHWNGRYWRRLHTGAQGDLWWISERPVGGIFLMAGDGGLLLSFEPDTGRFEKFETPGDNLMFGVWGAQDGHMWSVGGDLANEDSGGVVWVRDPAAESPANPLAGLSGFAGGGAHLGGSIWSIDDEAPKVLPTMLPTLYKVWGVDQSDVWASGRNGLVLHFDGIRWSAVDTGISRPLFTIHGYEDDVVSVGGLFDGVILELENGRFVDRTPLGTPQLNGVYVAPDGTAIAVGQRGMIARRTNQGWLVEETPLNPFFDYHAVWIDPRGGVWMVGGDLAVDLDEGVVAYAGPQDVGSEIVEDVPCPPGVGGGEQTVSYQNDIVPIIATAGCLNSTCHGGEPLSSGYDLTSWESTFGPGGQAGQLGLCNIVPGSPERSYLFEKISPDPRFGVRMPNMLPPLQDSEIALIETWIREGAQNDATPVMTATPSATPSPTGSPPTASCDDAGIICTVAGTGLSLFDGDGRDALETSFYYPLDVVFQPTDGLAIIDDWNNVRGRRIEADGTIRTIIGTGFEDSPENGALATETSLHHASELAFDAAGGMLVAGNHVPFVFRVAPDQRVEIVAGNGDFGSSGDGGSALDASWVSPFGVLPDGEGGFWVSDSDAHTIRRVGGDGIVRAVAGDGTRGYAGDGGAATAAQLDGPTRMALDRDGNLIFCDTGNHVLRRVRADGTIETFAGSGEPGYFGDGGPALSAGLSAPYDVEVTPDGTIYVADSGNHAIREITTDGVISTLAGNGFAGFGGDRRPASEARLRRPSGLALDGEGNLWIADTLNHRVRRIAMAAMP